VLTDEEREKIRIEENYRAEVRGAVGSGTKRNSLTLWTFFNSSLGLWLLSAIFITGAGALFSQAQHARSEQVKRRDAVERLDLEISYRFSRALVDLFHLTNGDVNEPVLEGADASDVERVMASLNAPPGEGAVWLYPDFQDWGLPALMAELRRQLDDPEERRSVDTALARLTGRIWRNGNFTNVEGTAAVIQRSLMVGRWKGNHFYFVDCPVEQPFC
jgi:hypothetical protein